MVLQLVLQGAGWRRLLRHALGVRRLQRRWAYLAHHLHYGPYSKEFRARLLVIWPTGKELEEIEKKKEKAIRDGIKANKVAGKATK